MEPESHPQISPTMLRRVELFRELNEAALDCLAAGATLRRHAPGEVLWRQGQEPRGLVIVLEGEVRVVRGGDGRRRVLHSEGAGGTLGEIPLFEGTRYPATAIAAHRSTCVVLDRDTLLEAMQLDPALALTLLRRLAGRVRHLIERLDRIAGSSVTARLAGWLDGRAVSDSPFTLGRTQQEVAEELGTVREVIVRELRALREAGILEAVGRGRFRVADRTALRRLVAGG